MSKKHDERFQRVAEEAAGMALLYRVSENGGMYGKEIDRARADDAAANLTGEGLYNLLIDAAARAAERAEQAAADMRWEIIEEVRRLAERSDSLSLYQFIERKDKENEQ